MDSRSMLALAMLVAGVAFLDGAVLLAMPQASGPQLFMVVLVVSVGAVGLTGISIFGYSTFMVRKGIVRREQENRLADSQHRGSVLRELIHSKARVALIFSTPEDTANYVRAHRPRGKERLKPVHLFCIQGIGHYGAFIPGDGVHSFKITLLKREETRSLLGGVEVTYLPIPDEEERKTVYTLYLLSLKQHRANTH